MDGKALFLAGVILVVGVGLYLLLLTNRLQRKREREVRACWMSSRQHNEGAFDGIYDAPLDECKSEKRVADHDEDDDGPPPVFKSTLTVPPPDIQRIEGIAPRNDSLRQHPMRII